MSDQLDTFEKQLLAELRDHVRSRTEATSPVTALRRPWWKTRLTVLAAGMAAATVAFTVLPGMTASPAYAVAAGPDGTVHVDVNRLEDAPGLRAALERNGVPADVQYLGTNTRCADGRYQPATSAARSATRFTVGTNGISIDIDRRDIAAGQTVVITASHIADGVYAEVGIADGAVRACQPTAL